MKEECREKTITIFLECYVAEEQVLCSDSEWDSEFKTQPQG